LLYRVPRVSPGVTAPISTAHPARVGGRGRSKRELGEKKESKRQPTK
jgi:hypothetical protein